MSARLERLKARTRSAIRRAAARVGQAAPTGPTLSLCVITSGRPEQVRLLLEAWRPHVDEVFLALDERGPHEEIASAVGGLADRLAVLPAMPGMERYLGWAHRQCTSDWILRVDDDELPSRALLEALPSLLTERELTHYWLPRRWVHPGPREFIAQGLWERDIQVRLVRNVPGIWRFAGGTHSNTGARAPGASSRRHCCISSCCLATSSAGEPRRTGMSAPIPGSPTTSGRADQPRVRPRGRRGPPARADGRDRRAHRHRIPRAAGGRRGPSASGRRTSCAPAQDDVERWNEDRPVSPGAYAARVRLVHPVRPLAAQTAHHVQVEVTNLGDTWWPRGPDPRPAILVGHRWRTADGVELDRPTLRTPFTESVGAGRDDAADRRRRGAAPDRRAGARDRCRPRVGALVRLRGDAAGDRHAPLRRDVLHRHARRRAPLRRGGAAAAARARSGLGASSTSAAAGAGWMRAALDLGVAEVAGVDGEWVDRDELEVPADTFRQADLAAPLDLDRRYDLAISLEVAEHLPEEAAAGFVASLVGAAPVVAFSAAIPTRAVRGHLNEQWPAYWAEHFAQHGDEAVDALRPLLWDDERVAWWYAQNLVIYASPDVLAPSPRTGEHPQRGGDAARPRAPPPARRRGRRSGAGQAARRPGRGARHDAPRLDRVADHRAGPPVAAGAPRGGRRARPVPATSRSARTLAGRCRRWSPMRAARRSCPSTRVRPLSRTTAARPSITRTTTRKRMLGLLDEVPGADPEQAADVRRRASYVLAPSELPGAPAAVLHRRRAHAGRRPAATPGSASRRARRDGSHRVPRQQRRPAGDRRLRPLAGRTSARGVPAAADWVAGRGRWGPTTCRARRSCGARCRTRLADAYVA